MKLTIPLAVFVLLFSPCLYSQSYLTVYNNFGYIEETRQLQLSAGTNLYRIEDLASNVETGSIFIDFETNHTVIEQHYNFDLFSIPRFIEEFTGEKVDLYLTNDTFIEGIITFIDQTYILLSTENGKHTLIQRKDIQYIDFPSTEKSLENKPVLNILVNSGVFQNTNYTLSYLFNGLKWNGEYLGIYDEEKETLKLISRAKIENRSGKSFSGVSLRLVSGEINKGRLPEIPERAAAAGRMLKVQAVPATELQEEKQYEYHIFTMERKFDILNNQIKHITLYEPSTINVTKKLMYQGQRNGKDIFAYIEFKNTKENGIGLPLPAGTVRLFKDMKEQASLYIGEDYISHSPENEQVQLLTGISFDIKGERIQTAFRRIGDRAREESYEITIRNNSQKKEEIVIKERLNGDWEIIHSSHTYKKVSSTEIEFILPVAGDSSRKIEYTVRYER